MKISKRLGRRETLQVAALVMVSIILVIVPAAVTFSRELSGLEASLLQGLGLLVGLYGSYLFGRMSARSSAYELVQVHARPAFRRLLALYNGLSRVAAVVARAQSGVRKREDHWTPLDVLEALILQQILTAGDAMEDWRDIVPEEVASVEEKVRIHVAAEEEQ